MINLDILNSIKDRIKEARHRASRENEKPVTIVAVTKTFSYKAIISAHQGGLTNIGENRVQEAIDKFPKLPELPEIKKRLIGHLQSNKARKAINLFDSIDSVDSIKLATRINNIGLEKNEKTEILLQVNTAMDPSKYGFSTNNKESFLEIIEMPFLNVKGLMTIGLFTRDTRLARDSFLELCLLREQLNSELSEELKMEELSMGMTNDFEIAVEEGATMLRLGSALFGQRAAK